MSKRPDEVFFDGLMSSNEKKQEEESETIKEAVEVAEPRPRSLTSRSVFSHPDSHPVVLDLVLLKHFQLEWFSWLPETLFHEIEQTFNTSIAEVNKLKIMAAKTLHVIDAFWDHWEVFEKTLISLNGVVPRLDVMQPPDLSLLLSGVDIANQIRRETFGEEVSRYCAAIFLHEHVHYAPEPLSFCQPYITQPTYCCKDCGKCGSALPPFDGLCSSCAGHYEDDKPLNFKPDPEALKRGLGANLTLGVTFDPEPIKARFEEFEAMPAATLAQVIREVPEDIQAAKLITAVDFKSFRAEQLKEQLGSLKGWLEMS